MSNQEFEIGQRWISDTEAELGLGLVLEVEDRLVTLSFPAAGERRMYSINNAPISRVRYQRGDAIRSAEGLKIKVQEIVEDGKLLVYLGMDASGASHEIDEIDLDSFVQFSAPMDRLFSGQVDSLKRFNLRLQTLEFMREQQTAPTYGLLGARVQLLPHQLYIANEVGRRYAPRVLLADEVGLGKTIEAGLIIHQQLINGRANRVLILVPDTLIHQWLVEMLRRFNLQFSLFTEDRLQDLEADIGDDEDPFADVVEASPAVNPFDTAQLVICPLSVVAKSEKRLAQALEASWDLLLVDEAHHLKWSAQGASPAYLAVEALAAKALGLLLLTATPEQLGVESHFARLRLLDPDRYYDLAVFKAQESSYAHVNELVQSLLPLEDKAKEALPEQVLTKLREVVDVELMDTLVATDGVHEREQLLQRIVNQLLDRHGTGRVLFRNTRQGVSGFPERIVNPVALAAAEDLSVTGLYPEQLLRERFGDGWTMMDARVDWLVQWLKQHRKEKVLVICATAQTALDLEGHLRLSEGFAVTAFHEGLTLIARDRAAAYFADAEDGAQALICSEIGSEGRNFQFASHLVMFDLPTNPDLLEQRIGRLDRIGQRRDVNVWVPYFSGSLQEKLFQWYHQGLNAFEQVCHVGAAIYETQEQRLQAFLNSGTGDWGSLLLEAKTQAEQLRAALEQGRNRLLELNSCREDVADEVIESLFEQENRLALEDYMGQVYDAYGVEQEVHSSVSLVLLPGDHMQCAHFPALPADGVTVTYQREMALAREDIDYLTWEHPMVSGAMDMVLSGGFGNTAVATIKLGPIKPGTLMLEAVFLLNVAAPNHLQLFRYLPMTPLRVLVDINGRDLSDVLSGEKLLPLLQKLPRNTAQQIAKQARETIAELVKKAQLAVAPRQDALLTQAHENLETKLGEEINRLVALAKVNPAIRPLEIEKLKQDKRVLDEYLSSASLKLDALRVILAT
ncbi:RNA polymerase-associated protein RapA [Simiduia curdlanivorans]|uniref:RNA polymerase-associated protein RapA n=1 Tax=Simiduia curdlanivorans TaxID=1492769 RepID=A0ABV8V7W0_9GAMM|nr:RNA polymerase-associated protein RapA [Simiduia curdlanivorans]MDN3639681.1 RNA polymerase-associated protein RapA [Simiduia curdlanivorans]